MCIFSRLGLVHLDLNHKRVDEMAFKRPLWKLQDFYRMILAAGSIQVETINEVHGHCLHFLHWGCSWLCLWEDGQEGLGLPPCPAGKRKEFVLRTTLQQRCPTGQVINLTGPENEVDWTKGKTEKEEIRWLIQAAPGHE